MWRQVSPILILLFKRSMNFEGVRFFLQENPSYIFVCDGQDNCCNFPGTAKQEGTSQSSQSLKIH